MVCILLPRVAHFAACLYKQFILYLSASHFRIKYSLLGLSPSLSVMWADLIMRVSGEAPWLVYQYAVFYLPILLEAFPVIVIVIISARSILACASL